MATSIKGRGFRVLGLLAILAVVAFFAVPVLLRLLLPDRHVSRSDVNGGARQESSGGAR